MNRQTTRGWLLGFAVVLLSITATVSPAFGQAAHVRWDLTSPNPMVDLADDLDVTASALASNGSKIVLRGAGAFVASPGGGGTTSSAVTGGGTWETFNASNVSTGNGTYWVTGLVRWDRAPGDFLLTSRFADNTADPAEQSAGRAALRIQYSDGERGILVVGCQVVDTPDSVFEGITASKGFVDYYNSQASIIVPGPSQSVGSASLALTGKIAYSCRGNICLFNLATGTNSKLPVSGVNAKLSPNGTEIAFQSSGGIYVIDTNGTNPARFLSFGGVPAWSPDGQKIAFHSDGIWVVNADGSGEPTQLTTHGRWAAWSPGGTEIAFGSNLDSPDSDLWIMNAADGTNARRVLSRRGEDIDVTWSPSTRIHFGGFVDRASDYEIFAFDPVTSSLNRLTASARSDFEPAASPDATLIAFASFRKPGGIYIMNADGSSPQLVIAGGRQPSWGP